MSQQKDLVLLFRLSSAELSRLQALPHAHAPGLSSIAGALRGHSDGSMWILTASTRRPKALGLARSAWQLLHRRRGTAAALEAAQGCTIATPMRACLRVAARTRWALCCDDGCWQRRLVFCSGQARSCTLRQPRLPLHELLYLLLPSGQLRAQLPLFLQEMSLVIAVDQ